MNDKAANHLKFWLPLGGLFGAVLVFLPKVILGNDIGEILGTALVAVIVSVILVIVICLTIRRESIAALAMAVVFCLASWLLYRVADGVHTAGRWFVESKRYKAEILAQPSSPGGELKHAEWDGWGFPGAGDTVVYVVFDPKDSLTLAAQSHSPGKYVGIPCEVPRVRRLENHWYTVLFYTDTEWDHC